MTRARRSPQRAGGGAAGGFLLVLVAGLLGLLASLALSSASLAGLARGGVAARRAALDAEMALASGLAYAASRLYASVDPFPGAPRPGDPFFESSSARVPSVANRGDDWRCRDLERDDGSWFADAQGPIPFAWLDPPWDGTLHPSWARGEAWDDANGNGLFDDGETWRDADGNGRRDVWSGRLRSGSRASPRFLLRAEPGAGAKIPINIDRSSYGRVAVIELLNRLGAVLGVATVSRETLGGSGVPVVWSDLGTRLFAAAPREGWTDAEQVRAALPEEEYRALRRFVTLSEPLAPEDHLRLTTAGREDPGTQGAPVLGVLHLNAVPGRLLEAFLRLRRSTGFSDRVARGLDDALPDDVDPLTGLPYARYPRVAILHPPEAWRAAAGLARRARETGGFRSRLELFRFIDGRKQDWFPNGVRHAAGASYPSEGLQNVKVDMVFASFFGSRILSAPAALATYDVDRFVRTPDGGRLGSGRQREQAPLGNEPLFLATPAEPYVGDAPFHDGSPLAIADDVFDWSLASPGDFDVSAAGTAGDRTAPVRAARSIRLGETIFLASQEDFQNLGAYPPPWGDPRSTVPGVRLTTRGIRVEGTSDLSVSTGEGGLAALDVVTVPAYPRETYDPGPSAFSESTAPGGVTLGHAPRDLLPPTEGRLQARFAYLGAGGGVPDTDVDGHLVFEEEPPGPIALLPVSRASEFANELYGDDNLANMRAILQAATPFGTSLSGALKYAFHQAAADGSNPNGLPSLDVGAAPVPEVFMRPFGNNTAGGDFRAITNLAFHFTHTSPLSGQYRTPGGGLVENQVFSVQTGDSRTEGACTQMRLFRRSDGAWILEFLNGVLRDHNGVHWSDAVWYGEGNDVQSRRIAGHTQRFEGFSTDRPWEASSEVRRVTVYYFARDGAGAPSYPPTRVFCGVLIDGEPVIAHTWRFAADHPMPYEDRAAYDPEAAPLPSAEMFYRVGPAYALNGLPPLADDGTRILDISFDDCTDVVFWTAPGGDKPVSSAVDAVRDAHDAYREGDFFNRAGRFASARYRLSRPAVLRDISWGGVVPESVWEGLPPGARADALTVDFRGEVETGVWRAVSLKTARVPAGACGAEAFCLPVGSGPEPFGRARIAAFSFDVGFDATDWEEGGAEPLLDVPAVEEFWISLKTPPRWSDGTGRPVRLSPF